LNVKQPYRVESIEKIQSNFADEQVLLATLYDSDLGQIRVFLPSRIQASKFSDEFVTSYNASSTACKMFLIFNGMLGRCIDVEFVNADVVAQM
jgi:hypothetical protein